MNFTKVTISLFLLLVYSLGYGHNLIPHHHEYDSNKNDIIHHDNGHHHHHHPSTENINEDPEHTSHENHFDEGFYDLLICFLHKTDHEDSDSEDLSFITAKSNRITFNKLQAYNLVTILFSHTPDIIQKELFSSYYFKSDKFYFSPFSEVISLRGPPLNS